MIIKRAVQIFIVLLVAVFFSLEGLGYYLAGRSSAAVDTDGKKDNSKETKAASFNGNPAAIRKKISSLSPKGVYIIIDTAKNRLYMKKGEEILREAVISTGSGSILKDPSGKREWVFDTPRGERTVKSKITNPAWVKPDWAFVEEGEEIPTDNRDRVETGMLGDYALSIGNGYLIHGTLYTRLLGRSVTHGCVRVGDEDLEYVYKNTPIGSKVILF
ncbi:MAG: L,D-transpeptidase [Thermodesulfovibrionia bacterium]|nr:L,D-transpeptidase [Thermodesulfovibrionia bacterium]